MSPILAAIAILVLVGLWAAQRSKHPFNIMDVLMDAQTGKASLNSVILSVMAALAVFVIIDRENARKDDVPELLLGVLSIFVLGRLGAHWMGTRTGEHSETVTTRTETTTKQPTAAPAGPAAPEAIAILQHPDKLVDRPPRRKR